MASGRWWRRNAQRRRSRPKLGSRCLPRWHPPSDGEGVGLAILAELYVQLGLAGSELRIIDLYDPVPRHSVGLAYWSNRYQNIAARGFSPLCRTIVPRLLVSVLSTVTTALSRLDKNE